MKRFILLLALLATTSSFACTDFTGTFSSDSWGGFLAFTQKGCESITFANNGPPLPAIADGEFHESFRGDIKIGSEVIAQMVIYSRLKFVDDKMILDLKLSIEQDSFTEDKSEAHIVNSLNSEGDLVQIFQYKDGEPTTEILKRIK